MYPHVSLYVSLVQLGQLLSQRVVSVKKCCEAQAKNATFFERTWKLSIYSNELVVISLPVRMESQAPGSPTLNTASKSVDNVGWLFYWYRNLLREVFEISGIR